MRKLRNRDGELLYTSDESSADEAFLHETKCSLIRSDDNSTVEDEVSFIFIFTTIEDL